MAEFRAIPFIEQGIGALFVECHTVLGDTISQETVHDTENSGQQWRFDQTLNGTTALKSLFEVLGSFLALPFRHLDIVAHGKLGSQTPFVNEAIHFITRHGEKLSRRKTWQFWLTYATRATGNYDRRPGMCFTELPQRSENLRCHVAWRFINAIDEEYRLSGFESVLDQFFVAVSEPGDILGSDCAGREGANRQDEREHILRPIVPCQ